MSYKIKEHRSCGAPVIWTLAHNGKWMPVDAEPVENGNITLRENPSGKVIAEYPGKEHPVLFNEGGFARARYVSHFATCKHSNNWRRYQ